MIYIFGSMHGDPDEKPELEVHFARLNKYRGIIALEFASNSYTIESLKRLKTLSNKEIQKVAKQHYGWTTAPTNFLKLLSKDYGGIKKIITIEPKSSPKFRKLGKALNKHYANTFAYRRSIGSLKQKRDLPSLMLREWFDFFKSLQIQCYYREKIMVRNIEKLRGENPRAEIFVYCGVAHVPFIERHFRGSGAKVVLRNNKYASELSKGYDDLMTLASTMNYDNLNDLKLLKFARDLLVSIVTDSHTRLTLTQDHYIINYINNSVRSLADYERTIWDINRISKLAWSKASTRGR